MKLVEKNLSVSEQTKQELAAALKVLLAQKPMDKITISELTGMCRIRRQSFYYHFEDIYDLLRWMLQNEAVVLLRQHEGTLLWQEGLLQLFRYLEENRAVCLCALKSVGRDHIRRFFEADIYAVIHRTIERLGEEIGAGDALPDIVDVDLLTHYHVLPLAAMLESWLLGEIDRTPEQLVEFAGVMISDQMRGAADRLNHSGSRSAPTPTGPAAMAAGPVSESANRANCAEVRCGVFRGDGSRTAAPGGCPGGKEFRWRWCRSGGPLPPPGCSRRRPGQ